MNATSEQVIKQIFIGTVRLLIGAALLQFPILANADPAKKESVAPIAQKKTRVPPPSIKKIVVETRLDEQPKLNFFIRIPGRTVSGAEIPNGVLCFCTWEMEDHSLLDRLKRGDDPLVQYADRRNLTMITWNTAPLLPQGARTAELNEKNMAELEGKYDRIAESWVKGIERICREHNLPRKNFLLQGVSRGANYAGRIAMRHPDYFLAVNIHIAGSYDPPDGNGAGKILWLVTAGELDDGYPAARQFYEQARKKKYPILIKAGAGLGHAMRDDIQVLALEFFDYALNLKSLAESPDKSKEGRGEPIEKKVTAADLYLEKIISPPFFGDLINQGVYPSNGRRGAAWIPDAQRIPLVAKSLADAWGVEFVE